MKVGVGREFIIRPFETSCRQDKAQLPVRRGVGRQLSLADGIYRWFLSRAVPIRNANGAVIRWFGTNTDTTKLKRKKN
jgi:PAS domain-containing protein